MPYCNECGTRINTKLNKNKLCKLCNDGNVSDDNNEENEIHPDVGNTSVRDRVIELLYREKSLTSRNIALNLGLKKANDVQDLLTTLLKYVSKV